MVQKPKKLTLKSETLQHLTNEELKFAAGAGEDIEPIKPSFTRSWLFCCISYGTDAWRCCASTT